ncbi:hypothetical protein F183_A36220 [Bryobacterales bacterium F-183]|nr:hypothetical protein F183_A36220 [Bryobacterales bacterium F-183]
MRSLSLSVAALLLPLCLSAANPAIDGNRFTFLGMDGGAMLEFTSGTSFRLVRWWGPAQPVLGDPVYRDRVWTKSDDRVAILAIDTRYLQVEIAKDDYRLSVRQAGATKTLWAERRGPVRQGTGYVLDSNFNTTTEKLYGFGAPVRQGAVDQNGQKFTVDRPSFYFSSGGYGRFLSRAGGSYEVDAGQSEPGRLRVTAKNLAVAEQYFYFGPSPKEIFEQHATATQSQVYHKDSILDLIDEASLKPDMIPIPVTEANFCDLSKFVNASSASGAVYQAVDLSKVGKHQDVFRMFPILYRSDPSKASAEIEIRRKAWLPYLRTYLREAYDRGLPTLRPLMMQFPRDAGMERRSDVFMLGDEMLIAPGCDVKTIELPRGRWTDLRTNKEYPGRTAVANDVPGLPVFVKMGSILPLVGQRKDVGLELHYYPKIGAEFFLIEPELGEYSQFHASPVGDILRVEAESKVSRRCEWILHHVDKPTTVQEGESKFKEVNGRGALQPGLWFYDSSQRSLHVMIDAKAGEDHIVNALY